MKNTLETRLGLFFALALLAAVLIMELVGGLDFLKRGYRVHALFQTVQELKEGDPVKMGGKQIGKVERISWAENRVRVTLKITDTQAAVKTDSKTSVKFLGLLGQNYVAIHFGSPAAPRVEPDTELTSVEQPDLSALMARLDSVAAGVENMTRSGENFGNLLGPFTDFLKENRDKLSATFGNLQTISSQIAEGKGTVGKLINEESLYTAALDAVTNFSATASDIQGVIAQAKTVVTQVEQGHGTIGKLTQDESLFREATNAVTQLRQVIEKINQGQGSVGKLVNDDALIRNAQLTLQKVDKAAEMLEDQGPLSVIGVAAGALF